MTELKKMTVHRALIELKTLDTRIQLATNEVVVALANRKSNDKYNGMEIAEFQKSMQASHDKVVSLIAYRNRIKAAVVESNAKTIVKIGEVEMTVANAIERKDSIHYDKSLLGVINRQYRQATATVNKENEELPRKLEVYLTNILGNREKASKEDVELHTKTFTERNQFELIDPLNISKVILKMTDDINEFEAEVDAVLSESNSTTFIEVAA